MNSSIVTVDSTVRGFGTRSVLNGASFSMNPGDVYGLIGLNGAGKTTLIRLLLGLLRLDGGICRVLDKDPWLHAPALYKKVGVVLEHSGFYGSLSPLENLRFYGAAKGMTSKEIDTYVEEWWRGTVVAENKKPVKFLSRGQRVQCGIARAFLGRPAVCFLDEPVVALDVNAYDHFCSLVLHARRMNSAVLISSHQLDAVEELCNHVGILENGTIRHLEGVGAGEGEWWMIKTEERPGDRKVIQRNIGTTVTYKDGGWHFILRGDATETIPRIVSELVETGCPITEVGPIRSRMRERIRRHYEVPVVPKESKERIDNE
jgi:ABC-2 type transport system ATP-binding protein